jgi:predicted ATP-grasp superfamily ATP-dependent carboligase
MDLTVLIEPWRPNPLAWIHRAEALALVAELRAAGCNVAVTTFRCDSIPHAEHLLVRVSDPVMIEVVQALTTADITYFGPGPEALAPCYDKYMAWQIVSAQGVDGPQTTLANEAKDLPRSLVLKPRWGSDSIGLRMLEQGSVPVRLRNADWLAQERLRGVEITVGMIGDRVGAPLVIALPEGVPYTFLRKYALRPPHARLADAALAARVRREAQRVSEALGIDWAVRIDFIYQQKTDRLHFLERDAAPLVGPRSAFAASFAAAGYARAAQLRWLLRAATKSPVVENRFSN